MHNTQPKYDLDPQTVENEDVRALAKLNRVRAIRVIAVCAVPDHPTETVTIYGFPNPYGNEIRGAVFSGVDAPLWEFDEPAEFLDLLRDCGVIPRQESVARHQEWQAGLAEEAFFDAVFTPQAPVLDKPFRNYRLGMQRLMFYDRKGAPLRWRWRYVILADNAEAEGQILHAYGSRAEAMEVLATLNDSTGTLK